MNIIQQITTACIAFLLFFSCGKEVLTVTGNEPPEKDKRVNISFTLTLPEQENINVNTRAYSDRDVKNVTVMVFDENNEYLERIDVRENGLIQMPEGVKFKIDLEVTAKKRTLHLAVNGKTADGLTDRLNFSSLSAGDPESKIATLHTLPLKSGASFENHITPLIFWGRTSLAGVNSGNDSNNVKLLRMAAAIKLKKGAANAKNGLNDFSLIRVTAHNGVETGYLSSTDYTKVEKPTNTHPYTSSNRLDYTKAWSSGAEPLLYLFEQNNSVSDYMSLIVEAKFKGVAGYYKIVLCDVNGAPLNIMRNHRYNVTITGVDAPGYNEVETAMDAAPSNALKTTITVDADHDYPCLQADASHWMALTNNRTYVLGAASGKGSTTIELCRVLTSRPVKPVVTFGGSAPAWAAFSVNPEGTGKYKIEAVINHAAAGAGEVKSDLFIQCDNLSIPFHLTRKATVSANSDADSYVIPSSSLLPAGAGNWTMWIVDPTSTNWMYLHPSKSNAAAFNGKPDNGFVTFLSSNYFPEANLHIAKKNGTTGEARLSANAPSASGKLYISKYIIVQ